MCSEFTDEKGGRKLRAARQAANPEASRLLRMTEFASWRTPCFVDLKAGRCDFTISAELAISSGLDTECEHVERAS